MPAVRLFGRRTVFGGDDLQPTAILTILVRLFQSVVLLVPVTTHVIFEINHLSKTDDNDNIYHTNFLLDGTLNWGYSSNEGSDGGGSGSGSSKCVAVYKFPSILLIYCIGMIAYEVTSMLLEWRLMMKSSIGSPTQPELRHPFVRDMLEFKLAILTVVNSVLLVLGVFALVRAGVYYRCRTLDDSSSSSSSQLNTNDDESRRLLLGWPWSSKQGNETHYIPPNLLGPNAWWFALGLLLASQFAEAFLTALALLHLFRGEKEVRADPPDPEISVDPPTHSTTAAAWDRPYHQQLHHHELAEEMWDSRCRSFCRCASVATCFLFGGRDVGSGDYGDIARAVADYFEDGGSELDIVPSDVVAGLVMLQRLQRQRVLEAREKVIEQKRREDETLPDWTAPDGPADTISSSEDRKSPTPKIVGPVVSQSVRERLVSDDDEHLANGGVFGSMCDDSFNTVMMPSQSSSLLLPPEGKILFPNRSSTSDGNVDAEPRSPSSLLQQPTANNHQQTALALRIPPRTDVPNLKYEMTQRVVLSRNDEYDRYVISEGARFSRHALAIYTWVLYVYMYPLTGPWRLFFGKGSRTDEDHLANTEKGPSNGTLSPTVSPTNSLPPSPIISRSETDEQRSLSGSPTETNAGRCMDEVEIIGEHCFSIHQRSLLAHAGLDDGDLRYAFLRSGLEETPYCIVVDHRWRSVVLAIRGTLSIEDCVADLMIEPEPLDDLGQEFGFNGRGQFCHSGILHCTKWLYTDLQKHRTLDRLLEGPNAEFPGYRLRIVGHSLGAGVATVLSLMLRSTYPQLRCICYSPPGCTLSWRLATECRPFVSSFALDTDMIPRLSWDNMELLRNEVLDVFGRIKVPKVDVAKDLVSTGCLFACQEDDNDLESLRRSNAHILRPRENESRDTTFAQQFENFRARQSEIRRSRGSIRDVTLFPPGKLVHLVKTGERTAVLHSALKCITCGMTNIGSEYTAVYAENDDFNEIVVSPTMWTDHFPNRVCSEIERVAAAFGLDTTLGSTLQHREEAAVAIKSSTSSSSIELDLEWGMDESRRKPQKLF